MTGLETAANANNSAPSPFVRATVNFSSPVHKEGHIHSLPELVDFNAAENPAHTFCMQIVPHGSAIALTNAQFKSAISSCAEWITENAIPGATGPKGQIPTDSRPVALLMESDIGLLIYQFALLSLGIPALVLSARLSAPAISHLVESTSTRAIIASHLVTERGGPLLESLTGYTVCTAPRQAYRFGKGNPKNHRYSRYPEDPDSTALILHSSGTTGLPKPIPLTHRQLVFAVSCHSFSTEKEAQGVNFSTLPLFHGFGLLGPGLAMSVGKTVCFPPTGNVPNALSIVRSLKATNAASLMTVPFLLDEICALNDEESITTLKTLDFVGTGGDALKRHVGDRLSDAGVKILNLYGTTETGPLTQTFVPKDGYDWRFFRLRVDMEICIKEMEPVSRNDAKRFKLTVFPFGADKPIEVADQLTQNPAYPGTDFAAVGRDDDVIVLANSEKVTPLALESMLTEHHLVESAIVFGEHRSEIGVMVEPTKRVSPDLRSRFKEVVWPIVARCNESMDAFARVSSPDFIVIAPNGITIPRTDKGSIARREVYRLFEADISAVYNSPQVQNREETPIKLLNYDNLERNIHELVMDTVNTDLKPWTWSPTDNFFDMGMDSLQATKLRRAILSSGCLDDPSHPGFIGRDFIYANPSTQQIAHKLQQITTTHEQGRSPSAAEDVEKFAHDYSLKDNDPKAIGPGRQAVVLLTGSSGSLGSHCLQELSKSPDVGKVVCLLRRKSYCDTVPSLRHDDYRSSILAPKAIELDDSQWRKICFVECDTGSNILGLSASEYEELRNCVTHIIHTAWPVDFQMQLPSFESQFIFLRNLIDLARGAHAVNPSNKPRFVFISSIATVARYGKASPGRIIPESMFRTSESACGIGYADGKLVCEHILAEAAGIYRNELDISIIRCGQLAGSRTGGFWNCREQIPMLLQASQRIGILPDLYGTLSWMPVDDAAAAICDILLASSPIDLVQHVENPIRQAWADMIRIIGVELRISQSAPFDQWLDKVRESNNSEIESGPVRALYGFFKFHFREVACGSVILGTDNARRNSPRLRDMKAVDSKTSREYIRYWRRIGYLD